MPIEGVDLRKLVQQWPNVSHWQESSAHWGSRAVSRKGVQKASRGEEKKEIRDLARATFTFKCRTIKGSPRYTKGEWVQRQARFAKGATTTLLLTWIEKRGALRVHVPVWLPCLLALCALSSRAPFSGYFGIPLITAATVTTHRPIGPPCTKPGKERGKKKCWVRVRKCSKGQRTSPRRESPRERKRWRRYTLTIFALVLGAAATWLLA